MLEAGSLGLGGVNGERACAESARFFFVEEDRRDIQDLYFFIYF